MVGLTYHFRQDTNQSADFTNGWPVGFFKEIFDHGRECSVQFALDECPPLAKVSITKVPATTPIYNGVEVIEVSYSSVSGSSTDD